MSEGLIHVGAWDGHEYIGDERRLLLVEPQKSAFAELKRHHAGRPNVALWNVACGARSGTVPMFKSEPSDNSSILPPTGDFTHSGRRITFAGTELVIIVTLDYITNGVAPYEQLVIDTQGYELEVLKGADRTLATLSSVSLEVHDPNVYPDAATAEQIIEFMAGWDVRVDEDSPGVCDLHFTR